MRFLYMSYQCEEEHTQVGLILTGYWGVGGVVGNPALSFLCFLVLVFSVQNPEEQNFLLSEAWCRNPAAS